LVLPLSQAARVIVPDEEALCQGAFSQFVHRFIRNFIHRNVDNGEAGRQGLGHTKTGAYNAGRTITVKLIRVPRLAVPLRSIFSAGPNETGIDAASHSGFGIILDGAGPVKGFCHQFYYQFCGRCPIGPGLFGGAERDRDLRRFRNRLADYTEPLGLCQGIRARVLDQFFTMIAGLREPPGEGPGGPGPPAGVLVLRAGWGLTFKDAGFMMKCRGGYRRLRRIVHR
jgi:hypothetical protein